MDYFANHRYSFLRWTLQLIGLWPFTNERLKVVMSFALLTTTTLAMLIKSIIAFPNIELVVRALMYFSLTSVACIMYLCYYCNSSKIKELWVCIEHDWKELERRSKSSIAERYASKSNLQSLYILIFISMNVLFIVMELILPVLLDIVAPLNQTRPNKSPFAFELPGNDKKLNFLIVVITSVFIAIVGTINIIMSSEFMVFMLHACLLFALAGNVLEHGFVIIEKGDATNNDKILYKTIVECVQYHGAAIRFTKLVDKSFNVACLLVMIEGIILLSVSSLCLFHAIKSHEFMAAMIHFLFLISLTGTAFTISHVGQLLIDHSLDVFNKVCAMPWYLASFKMRKLLVIILLKGEKPSGITHGKMAVLAHGVFTTVMQTAISFATVFISI